MTPDEAVARARALAHGGRGARVLLGIVGEPGAGKTTLARAVVKGVGGAAVAVPMDGFHLADVSLDRLGRRDRKGAIGTFDAAGYLALLRRIAADDGATVYAPAFARDIEQPIAGAIAVGPEHRLVVTEGNYLLDATAPWDELRGVLAEVWVVVVDDAVRRERLLARHVTFGKSPGEAAAWVKRVDEPNARRIRARLGEADAVVAVS